MRKMNDKFEIMRYNDLKMVAAELYHHISKGYSWNLNNLTWFLEFMDEEFPDLIGGENEQIHGSTSLPRGAVHPR